MDSLIPMIYWFFMGTCLTGVCLFLTQYIIANNSSKYKPIAKKDKIPDEKEFDEEEEKKCIENLRKFVYTRIRDSQWQIISKRLGILEDDFIDINESVSKREFCIGYISLCIEKDQYGDKEDKPIPIPLVKENRFRLEELGFEITEDNCSAIFKESTIKK